MTEPKSDDEPRRIGITIDPAVANKFEQFISKSRYVIIDDSDTTRDLLDLKGPAGPATLDLDLNTVLGEATKVIVTVGGPSELAQKLMNMAARPVGYFVLIDTATSRFRIWAEEAAEIRFGHEGLVLFGPRRMLPTELLDRCVADSECMPIHGDSRF
jgi:hypothetical protein